MLIPAVYSGPNIIPNLQMKKLSLEQLDHWPKVTQVRSDGWGCIDGLIPSPVLIVPPQEVWVREDTASLNCGKQQLRSAC